MSVYTELERQRLRDVPIESILSALGKKTEHGRGSLYFSPFRDERTPSFHIGAGGHKWYDFGTGSGGGAVALVCRILGCNGARAYDFLASVSGTVIPQTEASGTSAKRSGSGRIVIGDISPGILDRSLLRYAMSRGISADTLGRFCSEVTFGFAGQGRQSLKAIGLRNDLGGWVLRSQRTKRCTSNGITTTEICGGRPDSPSPSRGLLFEGLFDFLSFMEISGRELPPCDACILNSVVNLPRAEGWVRRHSVIDAFLDNDEAGRKALADLGTMCRGTQGGVEINDWSVLYAGSKDLNGRLSLGGSQRQELTIQYQSLWNNQFQRTFRRD